MTMLALTIATVAMALFAVATPAHHERRIGGFLLPVQKRRLRVAAWSMATAALAPAIMGKGWVFGPILWVGALMFGAAAVFLTLNLWPARTASKRR